MKSKKQNDTTKPYVVVIGGANIDIVGSSFGIITGADSKPGKVEFSLGGVARNIAHNLCLLGADVKLFTVYGDDPSGERIANSCKELGIDISHALCLPGKRTSTFMYIAQNDGQVKAAVSDMNICNQISPKYLSENIDFINNAKLVISDCNLPIESLVYLGRNCKAPLFIDPVSTAKASKTKPILKFIHTIKPNRIEAEILAGIPINSYENVRHAAKIILDKGVERVFISLGADGICCATKNELVMLGSMPCKVVDATGSGDAFTAALGYAFMQNQNLENTALTALATASIAVESKFAVSPELSVQKIEKRIESKINREN